MNLFIMKNHDFLASNLKDINFNHIHFHVHGLFYRLQAVFGDIPHGPAVANHFKVPFLAGIHGY